MRMRKKKNLTEKLDALSDRVLRLYTEDKNYLTAVLKKEYIPLSDLFGREAPIVLEIGCGKGQFACALARQRPDVDILGVEVNANVAYMAGKRAKEENIPNFKILCCKAEYLQKYLPDHSVSQIILNFSCPYPKNDYESHRLTSPFFLSVYRALMQPGAQLTLKTDNMHFFEYSVEQLSRAGFVMYNLSLDLHNSKYKEDNIITEYEQRFLNEGLPIYRLEAALR